MNEKLRRLLKVLTPWLLFYACLCLFVFWIQRSLLYFPSHRSPTGPLTAWVHEGKTMGFGRELKEPQTVWLMLHGNGGQASDRDYVLKNLSSEDALYVLEYPGYGQQPGSPSESAFNQAALHAYEILSERFPDTPIGVIGESIGSGPASQLANAHRPPEKIVLIVPYDSLLAVAANRYYFLPVSWLLLDGDVPLIVKTHWWSLNTEQLSDCWNVLQVDSPRVPCSCLEP
ncbi:MAG: hypothetical protein JNL67_17980 [Planctomycetaceae bacterium]|nr:hypothetical protein [Planctomycetaceae bacterium]